MSELIRTCAIAYKNGAIAAHKGEKRNKYGETKKELQHMWLDGYDDYKNGKITVDYKGDWRLMND